MNVSDSMTKTVQPVYGKNGQVHDTDAVPQGCSLGKGMVVNGNLHDTCLVSQSSCHINSKPNADQLKYETALLREAFESMSSRRQQMGQVQRVQLGNISAVAAVQVRVAGH